MVGRVSVRVSLLVTIASIVGAGLLRAAEHYVAPSGSPSGDGSYNNPWDLQTALNQPSSVLPGDTIWLRGGTYAGVGHYVANLNGTAANPIIVRQYAGERATIDGNYAGNLPTLEIHGSYTWYWGFEIFNSDPTRYTSDGTNPPRRGEGVQLLGLGTKMINMIVHDASQGVLSSSGVNTAEIYGNLIYYNGYDSPDRGHGHGTYVQNDPSNSLKKVLDNIILEQFAYGIHGYAEGGYLDNLDYEGNTVYDNGGISSHGWTTNILLGGTLHSATSPKMISNFTHNQAHQGMNNLGYSAGCTNPSITGNYFDSGTALKIVSCSGISMTGNTFYGSLSGFTQSQFPNNTYYSSEPTGLVVYLRPNAYEAGRANITVYNWPQSATVSVDVSAVLSVGQGYEVRNAADFFGAAVANGTYDGSPIVLPMTGLSVATPVGVAAPPATGPKFNVFILLPASPAGTPTPTPTAAATATRTPTPTSTRTATPTATRTPTSAATLTPSATPTRTPTATATPSSTPTRTATATATRTSTSTPANTATSTPTRTWTPTPAATGTASPTPTAPPVSATATPAPSTATPTATPTLTSTPTPGAPTATSTPTSPPPTATPTSPASTPTPTSTPTAPPPTGTATPTPTAAPPNSTPTVTPPGASPTPTPTPAFLYLRVEAESATLASPMAISSDVQAFGGQYISTPQGNTGNANWSVEIPKDGSYYVWCRVLARDAAHDTFYAKYNGGAEDTYDDNGGNWSPTWQWTVLNGRGPSGVPLSIDPRMLAFTAGTNTLHFRGGDYDNRVDRIIITDDPNFVPTEGNVTTFPDTPPSNPFYEFVETIGRNQITTGCGGGNYCPSAGVTRAQMAVFLLKAKHGASFAPPPATGTVFGDVPASAFAADWIEALAAEGITNGCGNGNYCPDAIVTRAQMAVFLLRAKHDSGYAPPPAVGLFADLVLTDPFTPWIEELANEGVTAGCGNGNYCPNAANTRGQMAAFLVRTFGLQ